MSGLPKRAEPLVTWITVGAVPDLRHDAVPPLDVQREQRGGSHALQDLVTSDWVGKEDHWQFTALRVWACFASILRRGPMTRGATSF